MLAKARASEDGLTGWILDKVPIKYILITLARINIIILFKSTHMNRNGWLCLKRNRPSDHPAQIS